MATMVIKSISQLEKEGWDKNLLYRICHMGGSPAFRTSPNGKFYFVEEQLKKFIETRCKK